MLLGRVATAQLSGLATLLEFSVRSYLVGNAGSRPISEAKQPWACLVLRWGTTGEAHVLYSLKSFLFARKEMTWVCTLLVLLALDLAPLSMLLDLGYPPFIYPSYLIYPSMHLLYIIYAL